MTAKLLTENHLELLSLKGGCKVSSESTLVKIRFCWKSHDTAQMLYGCYTCLCDKGTFFPRLGFFVCFVAFRPKSTAMVIAGRSVHLTTLFPGQA